LKLSEISEPEPDVAVVAGDVFSLRGVPTTAVLVVEVADTTLARDRNVNGSLYASANIAEYWIVNLQNRQLELHRAPQVDTNSPLGWKYAEICIFEANEKIAPLAKPDAEVFVGDLLP
jgi:Uma2 family endonuclease